MLCLSMYETRGASKSFVTYAFPYVSTWFLQACKNKINAYTKSKHRENQMLYASENVAVIRWLFSVCYSSRTFFFRKVYKVYERVWILSTFWNIHIRLIFKTLQLFECRKFRKHDNSKMSAAQCHFLITWLLNVRVNKHFTAVSNENSSFAWQNIFLDFF